MTDKINKYLVSADIIISILVLSIVLNFYLFSILKERIGIIEYKVADIEDVVFVNGIYEKVKQQARKEMYPNG